MRFTWLWTSDRDEDAETLVCRRAAARVVGIMAGAQQPKQQDNFCPWTSCRRRAMAAAPLLITPMRS